MSLDIELESHQWLDKRLLVYDIHWQQQEEDHKDFYFELKHSMILYDILDREPRSINLESPSKFPNKEDEILSAQQFNHWRTKRFHTKITL